MTETADAIYFFGPNGKYGFLSNFYSAPFGNYKNTEQYFMHRKCLTFDPKNTRLAQSIMTSTDPKEIKRLGRQVRNFDDSAWDAIKFDVMVEALRLKFADPKLKLWLKETAGKKLYEANPYDRCWGIGFSHDVAPSQAKSKYGSNLLGRALMKVRDE